MNISDYLKNKKITLKEQPRDTLFEIDWDWVHAHNRCPICECKLYPSLKFPDSVICRSKKHRFFKIKKWGDWTNKP